MLKQKMSLQVEKLIDCKTIRLFKDKNLWINFRQKSGQKMFQFVLGLVSRSLSLSHSLSFPIFLSLSLYTHAHTNTVSLSLIPYLSLSPSLRHTHTNTHTRASFELDLVSLQSFSSFVFSSLIRNFCPIINGFYCVPFFLSLSLTSTQKRAHTHPRTPTHARTHC